METSSKLIKSVGEETFPSASKLDVVDTASTSNPFTNRLPPISSRAISCSSSDYCQHNMSFDSSTNMPAVSHDSSDPPQGDEACVSPQSSNACSLTHIPHPVGEIRIPVPSLDSLDTTLGSHEEAPGESNIEPDDFKTLYLCGQQDLYRANQRIVYVCEENRLLKRKLIELQRQLFFNSRTKRRVVDANLAWSIPGEAPKSLASKRQRYSSSTPSGNGDVIEIPDCTLSPSQDASTESGRSPRVQFASADDAALSTVTTAED